MTKSKKEVSKQVEKCECQCCCKEKLDLIFYCLIAIIVILSLIFVTLVVKNTNGSTSVDNTTEESETAADYDVSMFDTLTTSEALSKISTNDKYVVYVGRSSCGYCVKFLPVLQQAQKDYGYKTIYIDLEKMTSEDQTQIKTVDNDEKYIEENLGYTPMVLIFENGKLSKGWVGYSEYDDFAKFLEENGYKK